jgi:hypothetical protein
MKKSEAHKLPRELLVHGRQKRVFLLLDNLRVHHSKAVKKWLPENEDIRME